MVMPGPGMEAGHFFTSERIKISAQAFNGLGDFLCRSLSCALEQHVLDEMADSIHFRRLVARADAHPQAEAYAGHVWHFCGGDRQAVCEFADPIHKKEVMSGHAFCWVQCATLRVIRRRVRHMAYKRSCARMRRDVCRMGSMLPASEEVTVDESLNPEAFLDRAAGFW